MNGITQPDGSHLGSLPPAAVSAPDEPAGNVATKSAEIVIPTPGNPSST